MDKNMMNHCPTRMREVFAFLLLIAASTVPAQEDCDNIVTIPELAGQVQEWQDAYHAVQVDTIIRVSEGTYEVQLSNGSTTTQVQGCTDPEYLEYNASANFDDGSCATFIGDCVAVEMDGYTYSVVLIDDQCWFAENLRSTVYADGTSIPLVTDNITWAELSSGARCDYDNDAGNVATYGRMYNWYAVDDSRGLCPSGWHVPTDGEWTELKDYITSQGFYGTVGTALKSTSGWPGYNYQGTDDFGFSALPGGTRNFHGSFNNIGYYGFWWSSTLTSYSDDRAWARYLYHTGPGIAMDAPKIATGYSVRCLKYVDVP